LIYLLLLLLITIFFQDFKERKVSLWIFPLTILLGGYLYYKQTFLQLYAYNLGINLSMLVLLFFIVFLYTKFKLKQSFFSAIGLGDILFFVVYAVSFPTSTFLVLFSCSLIFALLVFLVLKNNLKHSTVPLAGLQALFLCLILFLNLAFKIVNLYAI